VKSIELFSGAGGLALGLEQAGFESVALVERDADACRTLRLNRPAWTVIESDVRTLDFSRFGPVDLVAGGPPCQPFSMGGKAQGYNDTRDMFPQAVRAVRELRPRAFIFENVRGLLRSAFANYVEFIRLQLTYPDFPVSANVDWETNLRRLEKHHTSSSANRGLTYQVTLNLADAANYGVPQRRHRVFFVGFRSDLDVSWSFPAPTHSHLELLRAQQVDGPYWQHHKLRPVPAQIPTLPVRARLPAGQSHLELPLAYPAVCSRWQTVRDALVGLDNPRAASVWQNHSFQPGAKPYPGHTGSPLDEPSKALKAGDHGVPGGENMLRDLEGRVRYFTVRESARIQTFPDDWRFECAWSESMRQLGNAVPVRLANVVAASVARKIALHGRAKAIQPAR
jgi:DNA (cytosine-5)-methyltransferase 1